MQITKIRKIEAVTCSHYNRGSRIQDRAGSFAAGHPRGRRIISRLVLMEYDGGTLAHVQQAEPIHSDSLEQAQTLVVTATSATEAS